MAFRFFSPRVPDPKHAMFRRKIKTVISAYGFYAIAIHFAEFILVKYHSAFARVYFFLREKIRYYEIACFPLYFIQYTCTYKK